MGCSENKVTKARKDKISLSIRAWAALQAWVCESGVDAIGAPGAVCTSARWCHKHFLVCNVSPLPAQLVSTGSGQPPDLESDATMPPNRTSRPRHIPGNLIVNWRPSDLRDGAKPRLRRPVTACDACRTAKAKCSGKQECDRCTTRGLGCVYTFPVAGGQCPSRGGSVQPPSVQAAWAVEDITQGAPTAANAGSTDAEDSSISASHQPTAGLESVTPAGWITGLQHQSIHPVNWNPIDVTLNVSFLDIMLSCTYLG